MPINIKGQRREQHSLPLGNTLLHDKRTLSTLAGSKEKLAEYPTVNECAECRTSWIAAH